MKCSHCGREHVSAHCLMLPSGEGNPCSLLTQLTPPSPAQWGALVHERLPTNGGGCSPFPYKKEMQ